MVVDKDLPVVVEDTSPAPVRLGAPVIISDAGARATKRFFEFFTGNIRNRYT